MKPVIPSDMSALTSLLRDTMTYLEDWLQKREPTITMFKNNAVLRVLSSFESESVSGSIKGAFG
jgi:hypothetical protein